MHSIGPLRCKQVQPGAVLPKYDKPGDACLDLALAFSCVLPARETIVVKLGYAVAIPPGYEGIIRGRSGLAKKGIKVHLGTIDENYREEVGVIVENTTKQDWYMSQGDRIAQLAVREAPICEPVWVDELDETNRKGGFGHSGGMGSFAPGTDLT